MEHRRTEDLAQIKGLILAGLTAEGRRERSRGTGSDRIITTVEAIVWMSTLGKRDMCQVSLEVGKQRLKEEKQVTQSHPARKQVSCDLNAALCECKAYFSSLCWFSYLQNESYILPALLQCAMCFQIVHLLMRLTETVIAETANSHVTQVSAIILYILAHVILTRTLWIMRTFIYRGGNRDAKKPSKVR